RLAGQHPRAAERDRTRLHPLPGRGAGRRVAGPGSAGIAARHSRRADVAGGTGTPAHPARAGRNRHPGSRRPRPRHRCLHPVPQAQGLRTVTERARRRRRMYTSLLVAVVVVLLASSLLSLHTTARLSESVAAVSHTQRLQERINRLWGLLGDRDTHILRYLLLGRELHVEEFHNILRQMEKAQAQLQQEVGDDPVQHAALAEIDRLHQERIERAEYLIALKRRAIAGEPGAQAQLDEEFEAIPSNGNAEAMRALLEAMSEHEVAELERQQHQREQSIRQNRIIVLGANFLAVIAGVATLLAFRRLRRREDEALRASIEAQQAHRIASERQASLEVVAHDLRGHFGNLMLAAELLPTAHSDDARSRLAESVRGSATSGLLFLRAVLEQAAGEARGDTTTRLELEEA